jgi:hypothetical protein
VVQEAGEEESSCLVVGVFELPYLAAVEPYLEAEPYLGEVPYLEGAAYLEDTCPRWTLVDCWDPTYGCAASWYWYNMAFLASLQSLSFQDGTDTITDLSLYSDKAL